MRVTEYNLAGDRTFRQISNSWSIILCICTSFFPLKQLWLQVFLFFLWEGYSRTVRKLFFLVSLPAYLINLAPALPSRGAGASAMLWWWPRAGLACSAWTLLSLLARRAHTHWGTGTPKSLGHFWHFPAGLSMTGVGDRSVREQQTQCICCGCDVLPVQSGRIQCIKISI